ncbi:hypothetical protein LTR91_004289 [Friedmanniomyces endolithicus]|uniref:DUF7071 domain-containing protein n=1 Tax=Friedmanniomyces endolithicus TaxID=329885 RepID=A0AAN6KVS8_9PEZI|nr:hypothetical protein LTR94_005513 [Friedmanniomyces endolithicus]KAK0790727.1 hypothetical protein LTR38_010493 [Friedmanniomyces endolithicus]KAK0799240.1 hypothetical protein LTR59_006180 [Friedmanniomyces endolithicus]KAK0814647.1 hypothetical protein LTR75_004159 [Friedmanniomyces endolithicus]KAK0867160.1 hypothetical protein LTS02_004327 [Friedmanniomyces endolithicus]
MGHPSKIKRELEVERRAHTATSRDLDEALQVAQYLALKVESLRSVIATLAMGTELTIGLHGYSEDLEELERIVLARVASRPLGVADDTQFVEDVRESSLPPPLHEHIKRRKLGHPSSDAAMDFKQHFPSSDGLTINPAELFSSDAAYPSDLTWATTYSDQALPELEPEPDLIDLEALERQLEEAREVMGKLADTPVAVRILHKAEGLTRGQLERMRRVLEVDVEARTDMVVFADGLLG